MGLKGKLIGEVEIRSSVDLLHDLLQNKTHHVPTISPKHFKGFELHDGELGKSGAIHFWNYTIDEKAYTIKFKCEFDEANKTMTFKAIDGDLLQEFTTYHLHLQVKSEEGGYEKVIWTIEYEKCSEDVRFPIKELDVVLNATKDIENHHANDQISTKDVQG